MGKIHLKLSQKIEIDQFLAPIITKTTPGMCEYNKGWNDTEVAKHLASDIPGITEWHVRAIRTERYGNVTKGPVPINDGAKIDELGKRLNDLYERMSQIAQAAGDTNLFITRSIKELDEKISHVSKRAWRNMEYGMEVRWRLNMLLMDLGLDPLPHNEDPDELPLYHDFLEKLDGYIQKKNEKLEGAKKSITNPER